MAGTGITASSGVFNLDANQAGITSIGPAGTLTVNQDLTITGNLTVSGTTTTVDTATLNVEDINLTLGNGVGNDAAVNGGGITLDSSDGDKTILFSDANDAWELNLHTLPSADSTYDLGTTLIRWRAGYFDTVYGAGNFTTITGSGDVTIDTNVLKVDTTTDRVGVGQASPDTTDASTSTSTAIDVTLFDRTKFRAAKLLVEVENTTDGVFEVAEMILTHNGTSGAGATGASLTTYAVAQSDASETAQGTYDAAINGSNVELQVTPLHNLKNMTVKVSWQAITI
jgi:hypothetical protein